MTDAELLIGIEPARHATQLRSDCGLVRPEPLLGYVFVPTPWHAMRENHCPIFVGEIEGKAGRFDARLAEVHRDKDAAWLIAKLGRNSEDRSLTDPHQAQ